MQKHGGTTIDFQLPLSNRTFGFPEYGFPIIFFQGIRVRSSTLLSG
jgi:hypothetical protein